MISAPPGPLCLDSHSLGLGVKKTAQLGTGPREPKSDAKLQPFFHMAKYLQEKKQETLVF